MKKLLSVLVVFVFTLSACGSNEYNGKCELAGTVTSEYSYNDSDGFTYYKDDTHEYTDAELDDLNSAFAEYESKVEGVHDFIDAQNDILGEGVCTYSD